MHIVEVTHRSALRNGSGRFAIAQTSGRLRRWTVLPSGPGSRELLQLMAVVCAGRHSLRRVAPDLRVLRRSPETQTQIGGVLVLHAPWDTTSSTARWVGTAVGLGSPASGRARGGLPADAVAPLEDPRGDLFPQDVRSYTLGTANGTRRCFAVAWGRKLVAHDGTDDFDFNDPLHRIDRFASMLRPGARITDPCAFLERLRYKGVNRSRFPSAHMIEVLSSLTAEHFGLQIGGWFSGDEAMTRHWRQLQSVQQRALLPILDLARHLLDASPFRGQPYLRPGVVLVDRPDMFCSRSTIVPWLAFLDAWLPNTQFLISLSRGTQARVPTRILEGYLDLPSRETDTGASDGAGGVGRSGRSKSEYRLGRGTVLLVDVDKGRLPNVALMKLSTHWQRQGRRVVLARGCPIPRIAPGGISLWFSGR